MKLSAETRVLALESDTDLIYYDKSACVALVSNTEAQMFTGPSGGVKSQV